MTNQKKNQKNQKKKRILFYYIQLINKMDNVVNKFFVGDINQFGFGSYNSKTPNYLKILRNYPYPSTENNSIDKYFQNQNNSKIPHQNYIPNPVKLPNINNNNSKVDLSKSMSMPLKPLYPQQYDYSTNYNINLPKNVPDQNFSPPLIKMQVLEDRLNKMEYLNKEEFKKNMQNIEDKYIGNGRFKEFLNSHRKDIEKIYQQNFNYENNLPEIEEEPIIERRNDVKERINFLRKQIDYEKELIRERNKHKHKKRKKKKYYNDSSSSDSEDYSSSIYDSPRFKERKLDSTATSQFTKLSKTSKHISKKSPMSQFKNSNITYNTSPKSILTKKSPRRLILNGNCEASNKLLNQQDQLYDALNDLTQVVNDFKVELDNKLESFDINQRNSFNQYQNILNDGDYNLQLSMRKIINKENIDDEESERNNYYRYDLDGLIDQKIREYNRFREEEEIKKKLEDEEDEKRRLDLISKIEMDRVYKYLTGNKSKYVIENLKPLQVIGKKLPVIQPKRKEYDHSNSENRNESKNRIVIHFNNSNNSYINNNNIENIHINPNINKNKDNKNRSENININKTNKTNKSKKNKNDNNIENENKEENKEENKSENTKENKKEKKEEEKKEEKKEEEKEEEKEEKKEENTKENNEEKEEMYSEKEIVTLNTPRTILNYSEDDEEEEEEGA